MKNGMPVRCLKCGSSEVRKHGENNLTCCGVIMVMDTKVVIVDSNNEYNTLKELDGSKVTISGRSSSPLNVAIVAAGRELKTKIYDVRKNLK